MPTCADVAPIRDALSSLTPGDPVHAGALTVVPLILKVATPAGPCDPVGTPFAPEPGWLTLADAADRVVVTEVSEAGAVPVLTVANLADRPLLLLDGEELVGAKQNRVLNTTVLVAARTTVTIPVSCVEQGRWAWRARRATASDFSLFASARRTKAARVSESLRTAGRHDADQGEVWDAVADKARAFGVASPTGAMHDLYGHQAMLDETRGRLAPKPGQVGALVWIGRGWAGMELLAGADLFARAWPKLAAGYIADAFGQPPAEPMARRRAGSVLARVAHAVAELAPAVGLGDELRLASKAVVGAALVVGDRVAHLMAFPAPPVQHRKPVPAE
jgi:hypothetical protein